MDVFLLSLQVSRYRKCLLDYNEDDEEGAGRAGGSVAEEIAEE